ncbi:glycoside hydrolase family 88 protein [Paenibacillus rhizoplanae]
MLTHDYPVRPEVNEYTMTLGGVGFGPWPETFLYYDKECQLSFVEGECRPRLLRNYIGKLNMNDDFTEAVPPVFVTKYLKTDTVIELEYEIGSSSAVPFGLVYWDDLAGYEVSACSGGAEVKLIKDKLAFLRFNLTGGRQTIGLTLRLKKGGWKAMHKVLCELKEDERLFFEQALKFAVGKIEQNLPVYTELFPASASQGLVYPAIENTDWTASFWTGMVWLAYEWTGDSRYREAAEEQLDSFRRRVEERIAVDTHDLGFLYSLSAVAAYRITGNPAAREMALEAAGLLADRYFPEAGIIQAWGDLNDPAQRGRMIIDCLLNLPLLHWAAEETGDSALASIAHRHARQSARYLVRPDHTSYHTYYMDAETGKPLYGNTHQGVCR